MEGASAWGVAVAEYAWINAAVNGLAFFIASLVALLIWWRVRSGFGLLTAYMLLMLGSTYMGSAVYGAELLPTVAAAWELNSFAFPLFFLWLYLFPNGHAVPRRLLWVFWPLWGLFLLNVWGYILTIFAEDSLPIAQMIANLKPYVKPLILPLILLVIAAQVYRYFLVSGTAERKQTKWFLYILIIILLPKILLDLLVEDFPAELNAITFIALPIGIGIAILRYQLWDIDVIIRKTAVYAVLTALLALVYIGLVVLLQNAFDSVSGQQSPIAIVICTLVIAALFAPLRQRVQAFIDRRFFRKKYDAQQVLAQFAQTARDETDMEVLTAELIRLVQETMQPETVGIWLKIDQS